MSISFLLEHLYTFRATEVAMVCVDALMYFLWVTAVPAMTFHKIFHEDSLEALESLGTWVA
jgi:hypothetical protein